MIIRPTLRGLSAALFLVTAGANMSASAATRIEKKPFGKSEAGEAFLFTLTRDGAPTVAVTNQGGFIVSILAKDRAGNTADVTLGYKDFAGYLTGRSTRSRGTTGRTRCTAARPASTHGCGRRRW
jgi:hypothetical protein